MMGFDQIQVLGNGVYGDIYKCKRRSDNEIVCIKQIDLSDMTANQRNACWNEVRVLEHLKHPNIISYHDAFMDNDVLAIVMEYCDGGDLNEWIYNNHHNTTEDKILFIFVQIALGVHYLHTTHKILHRDLKPKNIFVCDNGRMVLGDFGVAKNLDASSGLAQSLIGSPAYMSPEIFEGKMYDYKADVWSLGCILYELLTSRCPFRASSYPALVHKITKGDYEELNPMTFRLPTRNLVTAMLSQNPNNRPSVSEILTLPFLQPYLDEYVQIAPLWSTRYPEQTSSIVQSQYLQLKKAHGKELTTEALELSSVHPAFNIDVKPTTQQPKQISINDTKTIAPLQNAQRNQRVKGKSQRTPIQLPLCEFHVILAYHITRAHILREIVGVNKISTTEPPRAPPVLKPRSTKALSPTKCPTSHPMPPPPPIGVKKMVYSTLSSSSHHPSPTRGVEPALLVVGTQLKNIAEGN